jgi:hypothetical protein
MPSTLEDVRDTLTGQSRRRWLPWRRKPTLTERVGDVTEQVGQTATDLTGQVAQTTGNLIQRLKGVSAPHSGRGAGESMPFLADLPGSADVSAARAANAAEAASVAAQSAASAVDRLGGWLALLASRAPQTIFAPTTREIAPEAALGVALPRENVSAQPGVTNPIKRAALTVGQRINDLSDGRYGLEAQLPKSETKPGKKAQKRLERQMREEAKSEQFASGVKWFPWVLGMSLGLVIGLVGVAYWQRRRLQAFWERASQRVQRATEGMGQSLESRSTSSPMLQSHTSAGPSQVSRIHMPASTDENNQPKQMNGRAESILP